MGAVRIISALPHPSGMSRKARPHPKQKRRPTFLKAWRKHRQMTLVQACERVENLTGYQITDGQLSRVERGEQPYSQDLLEALAVLYQTEPPSLLMRDPEKADMWTILDALSPPQRQQAVAVIEALRKTGTDG